MGPFDSYGWSESEARQFIDREVARAASTSSFYWESEEVDEVVDLLASVFAKAIAKNNAALTEDIKARAFSDLRLPPGRRF